MMTFLLLTTLQMNVTAGLVAIYLLAWLYKINIYDKNVLVEQLKFERNVWRSKSERQEKDIEKLKEEIEKDIERLEEDSEKLKKAITKLKEEGEQSE